MRIAFTADSQVDERSRLAEHNRVMHFIASSAIDGGCVALLHGGDVYERRATEVERASVYDWIDVVADEMAVVIAGGNHEAVGEVAEIERWFGERETRFGVFAREVSDVINLAPHGPIVAVLPWPRRASVAAWLEAARGRVPTAEETSATAEAMLRDVLRGLGAKMAAEAAPNQPRILLAHADVVGATTDPDQPAMVGGDIRLSVEDLMLAGADAVLLGHIHMPQDWVGVRADGRSVPVIYAGSPRRTAYARGERVPKGYVVLDMDATGVLWERVPTPATPLILLECRYDLEETGGGVRGVLHGDEMPDDVDGAEIRLRYTVAPDRREEARRVVDEIANRARARGAAEVRVEEVPDRIVRVRAPEIAEAPTVGAKLRALWATQGDAAPGEAQRARLLAKAERLVEVANVR